MSQSVYGMLKQENKKLNWIVIVNWAIKYASHQMELHLHLVFMITLSIYGMLKQDNKKLNLMVIVLGYGQYASHQTELH